MRLLNSSTAQLEGQQSTALKYAILSHRWGDNEVVFEDMAKGEDPSSKPAFAKVQGFCRIAQSMDLGYGWADSCCIDKSNSSELSEAINSMFNWYAEAAICIVYLGDVGSSGISLEESEWFSRGWTLQELIAPKNALFYDKEWNLLGSKKELAPVLSAKTGIPERVLHNPDAMREYSLAQRMSWAAHRMTTRLEDRAYSLMGLFDVNMDMRYGERDKAFLRLQEEIIKANDDDSIFAWPMDPEPLQNTSQDSVGVVCSGLLAPSPSQFAQCADISKSDGGYGCTISNSGIRLKVWLVPYGMERYRAYFRCCEGMSDTFKCGINLAKLPTEGQFTRIMLGDGISRVNDSEDCQLWQEKDVLIRPATPEQLLRRFPGFWLRTLELPDPSKSNVEHLSRGPSMEKAYLILDPEAFGTVGKIQTALSFFQDAWQISELQLGFDSDCRPAFSIKARTTKGIPNTTHFAPGPDFRVWDGAQDAKTWLGSFDDIRVNSWKGSHTDGLNLKIQFLNAHIKITLVPHLSPKTADQTDQDIWVLDVTELFPVHAEPELCCPCLPQISGINR